MPAYAARQLRKWEQAKLVRCCCAVIEGQALEGEIVKPRRAMLTRDPSVVRRARQYRLYGSQLRLVQQNCVNLSTPSYFTRSGRSVIQAGSMKRLHSC